MKPAKIPTGQGHLFQPRLSNCLARNNPLLQLGCAMDWEKLENKFQLLFSSATGRPSKPVRLIVGLMILQHIEGLSDEKVIKMWGENHYWQAFCGYDILQGQCPAHPTCLVRWRQQLKPEGMQQILQETLLAGQKLGLLTTGEFKQLIADTTVMPKAVSYPTDIKLLNKAREKLVSLCRKCGIRLRQSFARKSKEELRVAYRAVKGHRPKKVQHCVRRFKTMLANVMRQVERAIVDVPHLQEAFADLSHLCERLLQQTRKTKKKLYSLHAPETECIAKGKLHKPYEFGCKVAMAVTHKKGFVVSCQALPEAAYDGHTLQKTLDDAAANTGVYAQRAVVDRGYKKHGVQKTEIFMSGQTGLSRYFKKIVNRRSAIEPHIGHMKSDGKMDRNWLRGIVGNAIHAILCGIGHNARLLINSISARLNC